MLSYTVIGTGAAGNKAVIDLIGKGYNPNKVFMLNSTLKDIPEEYHSIVEIFGKSYNRLGGCGKERGVGRDMLLADLKSGAINLDKMVSEDDQAIILVGSTEGGSGSSSIPIMARYFKTVHNMNVICVLFFGFSDDTRGMKNSIELCQELSDEYTVVGISNAKFLDGTNSKFDAEQKANKLFCDLVDILTGHIIQPGTQIMDDTDLYKVVTTPGYLMAGSCTMPRPKTPEAYKKAIVNFLNDQGFVDPGREPGAKRIAMIYDVPGADPNVDFSAADIKTLYGEPFELFTHLSENTDGIYMISYIASGMRMPSEEIETLYNDYMNRNAKVNQSRDSFFDKIGTLDVDEGTKGFDMISQPTSQKPVAAAKVDFFNAFQKKAQQIQQQKSQLSSPVVDTRSDY